MNLQKTVDAAVSDALECFGIKQPIRTSICDRPGYDRQFNVMALAKTIGENPNDLAERITTNLREYSLFDAVEAVSGYVNLRVSDTQLIVQVFKPSLKTDSPRKILIDFGGPNIAKALHVGHLRSLVIGESLRRILLARGHSVISDIHYGDWGLPLGMLILEVLGARLDIPRSEMNFEDMYPVAVQKCKDDPKFMERARVITDKLQKKDAVILRLWEEIRLLSIAKIQPQIERLGAHFDLLYGESSADFAIDNVLMLMPHREDDGAIIIDVAFPTDKTKIPPVIFIKDDGAYTYAATDLATILVRHTYDTILYVVDNRQATYFEQIFRAASHFSSQELKHVGFGTVNGPDGKPYKTRDGGVPTLASLVDAAVERASERTHNPRNAEVIGVGAIKFADLITNRESGYIFDLDRILAMEGKTGPYLQYAVVRINAIFRMAEYEMGMSDASILSDLLPFSLQEHELLATCASFPEIMAQAEAQFSPKVIAEYAFIVAQKFSQFYAAYHVVATIGGMLTIESKCRLAICEITYEVLSQCLDLLGIDIPYEM